VPLEVGLDGALAARQASIAALPSDRATTSDLRQFTEADYLAAQRGLEGQFRLVRALDAAGAGLLVGTDSWPAGYAFADELDLLSRAGLTPARVLRMATIDAARFLGEEADWGVVAAGRHADLILLDADPLVRSDARRAAVTFIARAPDRSDGSSAAGSTR